MNLKQKEHEFHLKLELEILEKLSVFVRKNFTYTEEPEGQDYWPTAREAVERFEGRVDCVGYSTIIYNRAVNKYNIRDIRLGILARYNTEEREIEAHMVVLYYPEGEPKSNPYVIPTTGAVSERAVRLSRVYTTTSWRLYVSFNKEKKWKHYGSEDVSDS